MKKFLVFLFLILPLSAQMADVSLDTDGDGLTDIQEMEVYYTDATKADTDGDGYNDRLEIVNGYSALHPDKRITEVDLDNDGLNDGYELALKTGLKNPDSDNDGYSDGEEFIKEYDPRTAKPVKLEKRIEVSISQQRLEYFLGPVRINKYIVSTGKASTPTPIGEFTIDKKKEKAWSQLGQLWMPFWMSFNGVYAIHELPEWTNGTKEGANHLGIPVSHGCVRLGIGPAKELYEWAPVGTKVVIHK